MTDWHGNARAFALAFALGALGGPALAEAACGGPEAPCAVGHGTYHAALPDEPAGAPVVLWLHGYASSGRNAVKNAGFAARYTKRGYALIAPNGQPDIGAGENLDWGVDDGHDWPRDDVAFLRSVLADAIRRFGLDGERVLAAGFSRGGSMIWDLACAAPESAAGFAAVAGAFWEPMQETCAAPVHLQHTHGFSDRLVPLEGREVTFQGNDFVQGNVFKALEVWRRVNGCLNSASEHETGALWLKRWGNCETGSLALWLSPGGHGIPRGWTARALDWFEGVTGFGR